MSSTEKRHPRLLVFAGPNGSGKSTVTQNLKTVGLYINADDIKRVSGCTDMEAAIEAEALRNKMIDKGRDFTFETVLSTDRNVDLLNRAKEAGYEIHVIFVLTHDPEINVRRVKARAAAGGHDVPEEKVRVRFARSLARVSKIVNIADRVRIIDNSGDIPSLICEVENHMAQLWPNEHWSKKAILRLLSGAEEV
ncbi:MAG: zeta toxin family protein [Oscillospiraceae bacterium]|nr:zeta toxin family protein [Oscillospiraceae bacterium]